MDDLFLTPRKSLKLFFQKSLDYQGTSTPYEFLWPWLLVRGLDILMALFLFILDRHVGYLSSYINYLILIPFLFVTEMPMIALHFRRFHDSYLTNIGALCMYAVWDVLAYVGIGREVRLIKTHEENVQLLGMRSSEAGPVFTWWLFFLAGMSLFFLLYDFLHYNKQQEIVHEPVHVSMFRCFGRFFTHGFDFSDTSSRTEFWCDWVFMRAIGIELFMLMETSLAPMFRSMTARSSELGLVRFVDDSGMPVNVPLLCVSLGLGVAFWLVSLVPRIALHLRRFHDADVPTWLMILLYVFKVTVVLSIFADLGFLVCDFIGRKPKGKGKDRKD